MKNERTGAAGDWCGAGCRLDYARMLLLTIIVGNLTATAALDDGQLTGPLGGADPPWGVILFVNGVATDSDSALEEARVVASAVGCGVRLVYNDLQMNGWRSLHQGPSLLLEKLGGYSCSPNAATEKVIAVCRDRCEAGQSVWLVGYSGGSLCIQNALNHLEGFWGAESRQLRRQCLGRIAVLYIGGAVFRDDHFCADGTPPEVPRFELYDQADGIAQLAGPGHWGHSRKRAHLLRSNYVGHLSLERRGQRGELLTAGGTWLVEAVAAGPQIKSPFVRVRLLDLRQTEQSRRTAFFRLPWAGPSRVTVVGYPRPDDLEFAILEHCMVTPDQLVRAHVANGEVLPQLPDAELYLGRVRERTSQQPELDGGAYVIFRSE